MGEKRMFAKAIVMSDAFLDLNMSARCLYYSLGMYGDDDGFVNAPKSIMRQIGATIDDLNLLVEKKFIIMFESGVIAIKHWRINNYLRNDRYRETSYQDEKQLLRIREDGAYEYVGIPTVDQRYTSGIPNITEHNITKHNTTEQFEEFWKIYPKKVDKKKAAIAFERLNPDEELFEKIKKAIDLQKKSDQWQRGYVPNATSWLTGERWNDDLPKVPAGNKKYTEYMQREPVKNERFGLEYLDKKEKEVS